MANMDKAAFRVPSFQNNRRIIVKYNGNHRSLSENDSHMKSVIGELNLLIKRVATLSACTIVLNNPLPYC